MAYGFTFYRARTVGFDTSVENTRLSNPSLAAQIDADRAADSQGALATRLQVLEAFSDTETAPILPSETLIRQWMISGLGFKRQSFIATQNSLFNNDSTYATKIASDRAYQANVLSPLTLSQTDNQNGFPSQSTQDTFGNNKTVFLLGIDNNTITGDLRYFLPTSTINSVTRDDRFYNGAIFDGSSYIFTQSNPAVLNNGGVASYSIEGWIYRTSTGEVSLVSRVGGSTNLGVNQLGIELYINSSNLLVWEIPPYQTITSVFGILTGGWNHFAISYQSGGDRRMYINGILVGSKSNTVSQLVTETLTRKITSFLGNTFNYLGFSSNAVQLDNVKGFSLYDKVKVFGYLPSGQTALSSADYTIIAIDYVNNRINLGGASVANTGTAPTTNGSPLLARTSVPANSASRRGVIGRSPVYNNRIFLDPVGQPNGVGGDGSGVQEMEPATGNAVMSYVVGEKVAFSGVSRGGTSLTQVYYITSVVLGGDYGGYITVSLQNLGQSLIGGDVVFDPWTDTSASIQMYINKIPDNIEGGASLPTQNTILMGTSRASRNSSTTNFKGILGGIRMVTNATPYTSNNFTSPYPLTAFTGGGSTNLLINSTDGSVPINTGQGSLNLGYFNRDNIATPPRPNYLGTVYYDGMSTYTNVTQGGSAPSGIFTAPPSTNWCAEAWIYPFKSQAMGIVGSGTTAPNFWALTLQSDNSLVFYYDNSAFTGSVTNASPVMSNVSNFAGLSPGVAIEGPGITSGTTIASVNQAGSSLTLSANATSTASGASYTFGGTVVGSLSSGSTLVGLKTWSHVAVSLNGNTLRLFLNGVIVASTTIAPRYFKPNNNDSRYYVGLHAGAYFYGYIATPRLVIGKSIYTSNFTVSDTKPRVSRTAVLNAYAANPKAVLIPDETAIQYWMHTGFDDYSTVQFSSTDITWNQVDSFYKPGNTNTTKTYPSCVGKEILVNQILIGTPDINQAYYSNTLTTNSSDGSISASGGTVDAYITVLMR